MTRKTSVHLIAVEAPTAVSDGQGGREQGWEEVFQCRARRMVLRGREEVISGRLAGVQTVVFFVRSADQTTPIQPEMRIRDVDTQELYNLRSSIVAENRHDIEITATLGDAV